MPAPHAQNPNRREGSFDIRVSAARLARARVHPTHVSNPDETTFRTENGAASYIANFTKGLPHDRFTGLRASPADYRAFVRAIDSGDERDIAAVPLGPPHVEPGKPLFGSGIASESEKLPPAMVRGWESMGAGLTYDLEGPDAQAVTVPPAPQLESDELVAEIAELYWMALIRDVRFTDFKCNDLVARATEDLNSTAWISRSFDTLTLTDAERERLRGPFTEASVFRGVLRGDNVGPYLSQFLLVGTTGLGEGNELEDGFVSFGSVRIDQRVRVAEPGRDYMTTWEAWLDVQNGADVRGREVYVSGEDEPRFRFITTPRDLATYVHFDAHYQAYLTACLVLLGIDAPFDSGLPFLERDSIDGQEGFATFGAPQILTLVGEVASRALKAIRFQKFNLHRRARPEAIGGLVDRVSAVPDDNNFVGAERLTSALSTDLLALVAAENARQNAELSDNGEPRSADFSPDGDSSESTKLLPMAFPEGSPMHPSYGAGHAAVAGACVTILKAFFETTYELPFAFVPSEDGTKLVPSCTAEKLTVEGELNKLCSNVAIGRNWAGVHYFTDYIESIALGEEVALGLLEEQKLTFGENFSMFVPLFDGSARRI